MYTIQTCGSIAYTDPDPQSTFIQSIGINGVDKNWYMIFCYRSNSTVDHTSSTWFGFTLIIGY